MKDKNAPLGVFDSGIGGLTVVNAIHELLPKEKIVYLGDTARVPYGNKSPETVVRFAREVCDFLVEKGVKAIVVACNTASAHALPDLQKEVEVPVFGVIKPGVRAALEVTKEGRIGIIGTMGTVRSQSYQDALMTGREGLHLIARATPLFVPLIEEDWIDTEAARLIAKEYLKDFKNDSVDTVVLACTHYPLMKGLLQEVLGKDVRLVDSASTCAKDVKDHLEALDQMRESETEGKVEIYLTDMPLHFEGMTKRFLKSGVDRVEVVTLKERNV